MRAPKPDDLWVSLVFDVKRERSHMLGGGGSVLFLTVTDTLCRVLLQKLCLLLQLDLHMFH